MNASQMSMDTKLHASHASAQSQGLGTRTRTFQGLSAAPSRSSSSRPDPSRADAGKTPQTDTPHGSDHESGYGSGPGTGSSPHSQPKAGQEQEEPDPSWERIAKGLQGDTREYGRGGAPGPRLSAGARRQSSLGVPAADAKVVARPLPRAGAGAEPEEGSGWGRLVGQPSPTASHSTASTGLGEQTGLTLPALPTVPGIGAPTGAPQRAAAGPALPRLPGGPVVQPPEAPGAAGAVSGASSDSSDSDSSGEAAEDDATRSGRVLRVLVAEDNKINQKVRTTQTAAPARPRLPLTPQRHRWCARRCARWGRWSRWRQTVRKRWTSGRRRGGERRGTTTPGLRSTWCSWTARVRWRRTTGCGARGPLTIRPASAAHGRLRGDAAHSRAGGEGEGRRPCHCGGTDSARHAVGQGQVPERGHG